MILKKVSTTSAIKSDRGRVSNRLAKISLGMVANIALQGARHKITDTKSFLQSALVGGFGAYVDDVLDTSNPNSKGFQKGLTCGTVSGLVIGVGNALINNENVLTHGLPIMGSVVLLRSAFSSIPESKGITPLSPDKWIVTKEYELPNGNLPIYMQESWEGGCAQMTLKSIADYLDRPIKEKLKEEGSDFLKLAKSYGFKIARIELKKNLNTLDIIGDKYLSANHPAAITYREIDGRPHVVGINKIVKKYNPKKGIESYVLNVMDPMYDEYRDLYSSIYSDSVIDIFL